MDVVRPAMEEDNRPAARGPHFDVADVQHSRIDLFQRTKWITCAAILRVARGSCTNLGCSEGDDCRGNDPAPRFVDGFGHVYLHHYLRRRELAPTRQTSP